MISISYHAATEHSEFDSLVMYARRKIVSGSDHVFYRVPPHFLLEMVPAGTACLTEHPDTLSVFTSPSRGTHGIIFIDKYLHNARFTELCPNNSKKKLMARMKKSRVFKKNRSGIVPQQRP